MEFWNSPFKTCQLVIWSPHHSPKHKYTHTHTGPICTADGYLTRDTGLSFLATTSPASLFAYFVTHCCMCYNVYEHQTTIKQLNLLVVLSQYEQEETWSVLLPVITTISLKTINQYTTFAVHFIPTYFSSSKPYFMFASLNICRHTNRHDLNVTFRKMTAYIIILTIIINKKND